MFRHAIVRRPCQQMVLGLTTAKLGRPKYELALEQHDAYIEALIACGLGITIMDADEEYPDSTFVEDTALCTPCCAIVMRPAMKSRRGETDGIKEILSDWYENIDRIKEPCTAEGGDVMMVGSKYYIGKSSRTDDFGANQLINFLEEREMKGIKFEMEGMLHLKTGVAYLENNTLLARGEIIQHPLFKDFTKIKVEKEEELAANSIWVNGTVLTPSGNPITKKRIEKAGYKVVELDVSEFQKLDGGLSCLSLRI